MREQQEEEEEGDKVVCGQSQQREMTICLVVFLYLFVWLGHGGGKSHKASVREKQCYILTSAEVGSYLKKHCNVVLNADSRSENN